MLTKLYYGVCFNFRQYVKIKGLGYFIKYMEDEHKICLIFGKSNYEYIQMPANIQISLKPRKKKQAYKLTSTSDQILNLFSKQLQTKALPDPYRLKGIRFIRQQLTIKPGKKKK